MDKLIDCSDCLCIIRTNCKCPFLLKPPKYLVEPNSHSEQTNIDKNIFFLKVKNQPKSAPFHLFLSYHTVL